MVGSKGMPSHRRVSVSSPEMLAGMWESVGAGTFCRTFSKERKDTSYLINSSVDFEAIADNIDTIVSRLLKELDNSFPDIFTTFSLLIQKINLRNSHRTTKDRRSRTNKIAGSKWTCMGYARTVEEWKSTPINKGNTEMTKLQHVLLKCKVDSAEKFVLIPLKWSLSGKENEPNAHYLCLVVDMAPERSSSNLGLHMHVTIVDPNGKGDSPDAYKQLFTEPKIGLNVLIKHMITSLFTFARSSMGYKRLTVTFPAFSSINISTAAATAAGKRDKRLFETPFGIRLENTSLEKGICSIATLFVIIRMACDQRKVLKEGIDKTLQRFTKSRGDSTEYQHVMFVRSFIFVLMRILELDEPKYGIKGRAYVVEKRGTTWSIMPEAKR